MFLFAVECKKDATCVNNGKGKDKCDGISNTCGECHCSQTGWKTNEFILTSNVTLIHPPSFHYAVQCTKKADCSTVQGKPECSPLKTCGELVVIDFCLRILNWKRPKTRWIFKWVKNEFIFSKGFIVFTAGFFYQNCKKTHGEIILPKFNKLRSVKLRALDFTTLNFSSNAI